MAPHNDEYRLTASEALGSSPSLKKYQKQHLTPRRSLITSVPISTPSGKGCCKLTREAAMKAINCSLLILLCLASLIGAIYLMFDPIVQHIVLNRLVLRNHSDFAQIWENPPITPHLKVYFFNLTNAEKFFEGLEPPQVQEVGPYVYHQKWIKEDVSWHENGTMGYKTRKEYKFMPELSIGNHSTDQIITLNVPVISAMYQMRDSSYLEAYGMTFVVETLLNYDMWVKRSPEELVWGYHEPLFELAKLVLPSPPKLDKFGFFTKNNNTADLPKYTMYTGEGNPYNLSKISLFNGQKSLKLWGKNPETEMNKCNIVQGSDGATFNPYIEQEDVLWFFNDQLCQSMPLVFDKEITSVGLPGYRFVPRNDVFKSPISEPANSCYCDDEPLCNHIGDGMFAVPKCQMGAPIVLSWPHFLNANSSFIDAVGGIRPDKDEHEFYFDVQQTTGTTLSARARIQINVAVLNIPAFNGLSKVNTTIMPVLWFDEGLEELGDDLRDIIAAAVLDPPVIKDYVLVGLAVVIGIIIIVGSVSAYMTCKSRCSAGRRRRLESGSDDKCAAREFQNLNEDKFKSVRLILEEKIHTAPHAIHHHHHSNINEDVHLRLLESGSTTEASSTDSSRISSASHSRNSSTGSNISNQVKADSSLPPVVEASVVISDANIPEVPSGQALLDPDTRLPNV